MLFSLKLYRLNTEQSKKFSYRIQFSKQHLDNISPYIVPVLELFNVDKAVGLFYSRTDAGTMYFKAWNLLGHAITISVYGCSNISFGCDLRDIDSEMPKTKFIKKSEYERRNKL